MTTTTKMEGVRCPTTPRFPGDTVGCGSMNVGEDPTEPGVFDCFDCGIWFTPAQEPATDGGAPTGPRA